MYKNYFYLNRLAKELDQNFKETLLVSTFSQEKNVLVLEFENSSGVSYLLISVSQNEPYIQYRKEFHRAKKNVSEIFRGIFPQRVKGITIAEKDRVIKLSLDTYELIFFIRGKDTNIVLTDTQTIKDSFKKQVEPVREKIEKELKDIRFTDEFYIPDLNIISGDQVSISTIKQKFPFLSKEILNEARGRIQDDNPRELLNKLNEVIKSIYFGNIAVFYDENIGRVIFSPEDFRLFSGSDKKLFSNYLDALNYFLISRFRSDRAVNYKKLIAKTLDQQLSRISSRINEIRNKLEEPSREEQYRNLGNLLLANINSVPKGIKQIELQDFNEQKIIVKLDEKLDARKNAEVYFDKAKNDKQSRISLSGLFRRLEEQYRILINQKNKFESANKDEDYLKIMADLRIRDDQSSSSQQDESSAFKHYLVEKKYHVYVGKDSRNNDQLTTRFAKQNDYWFHARSVSGSHVVLRVDNSKEVIPKSVLKKTAAIAAYHSKAKTSKLAPVSYTFKKYVVKRKGMEPGSVNLLKESVILVEPGIPEDCEYLND